jgi:endonuclease-3
MTAVSRAAQFAKIHKVLKKYYKVPATNPDRAVIEHLLFACCLEDASYEAAEEGFAALVHTFFDWNEVRVTSVSELSEVMARLPDPRAAANRVKRVLHSVFEAMFDFDLEPLRKKNLGPTVQWFEKLDGASTFTVSYVVQAALGGHAIPIDGGTMAVLKILDLVTDEDVKTHAVPGLERAIAKSKGVEFGVLLHELGAAYSANSYSPTMREILLQIEPKCEARLPKRRSERLVKKQAEARAETPAKGEAKKKAESAEKSEKPSAKKKAVEPPPEPAKKKSSAAHETAKKPAASEKGSSKHEKPKHESASKGDASAKKRSASEGLSKRKPR